MQFFQNVILNQWVIASALGIGFLFLSRWALINLRKYAGYGLGCLLGIFFVVVYALLSGDDLPVQVITSLTGFQIVLATLAGFAFGAIIITAVRFGQVDDRAISIQIALYTMINIILIFLVLIEGAFLQRIIGIFALATGIATVFAMVLFPDQDDHLNLPTTGQTTHPYNVGMGGGGGVPIHRSRLDEIRERMNQRARRS